MAAWRRRGARRNPPRCSARSPASSIRSSLQRNPGRNLDGNMDWDSRLTLGRASGCYSARNRTRSGHCSLRGNGRSNGGSGRQTSWRSDPRRSSGSSSERDFGGNEDSYGGGIGGVGDRIGVRGLGLGELGLRSAGGGTYTIIHIRGWNADPEVRRTAFSRGAVRFKLRKPTLSRPEFDERVSGNWSLAPAHRPSRALPPPQAWNLELGLVQQLH
jgi:hypothetical protein